MLRVTVPDFQKAGEWITYDAPESSEPFIREHIINQYPAIIQTRCKIEQVSDTPTSVIEISEPPKPQPKTPERIKLEARAAELEIRGIELYNDEKLKERIELKQGRLNQQPLQIKDPEQLRKEFEKPVPVKKKPGRPKKTVA